MGKKYQKRAVKYINEVSYFEFKEHSMISIPIKTNPESGYGEAISMGVSKARGILDNMIALRNFVKEHEDEVKTISEDAHLKKQDGYGQDEYQ